MGEFLFDDEDHHQEEASGSEGDEDDFVSNEPE